MNSADILAAIMPIIEALEQLKVDYHIGGSVSSSVYGIMRATLDADMIVNMRPQHVRSFVNSLKAAYYIDENAVRDAIRHKSSFNAIHLDTMLKVDVYIPKDRLFDKEELRRVRLQALVEGERPVYFASPEDTILNKLEWYRMDGEVSDRQWNDILGVLKVQGTNLDIGYLRKWARYWL